MALLTLSQDNNGNITQYTDPQDVVKLLFYCSSHCINISMNKLYPLGMSCICDQFLYVQFRRVKPLTTRAYHYILSFDTAGYESFLYN